MPTTYAPKNTIDTDQVLTYRESYTKKLMSYYEAFVNFWTGSVSKVKKAKSPAIKPQIRRSKLRASRLAAKHARKQNRT